ncbi:hypothetical protein J4210_05465 [Candidatus Woesearchaeota archaeon]|nr:hypothetical protein [Candidatus Woesearchaeota archaeon]
MTDYQWINKQALHIVQRTVDSLVPTVEISPDDVTEAERSIRYVLDRAELEATGAPKKIGSRGLAERLYLNALGPGYDKDPRNVNEELLSRSDYV